MKEKFAKARPYAPMFCKKRSLKHSFATTSDKGRITASVTAEISRIFHAEESVSTVHFSMNVPMISAGMNTKVSNPESAVAEFSGIFFDLNNAYPIRINANRKII